MIDIDRVTVQFGGVRPLDDLTLQLDGNIVGIVGPNGAGKTTLLNVMSGFVKATTGSITVEGTDILAMTPYNRARWGIRRTFQTEQVVNELTVHDNVSVMLDTARLSSSEKASSVEFICQKCRKPFLPDMLRCGDDGTPITLFFSVAKASK